MEEYKKEKLKWKFLLSKCKIYAVVFKGRRGPEPLISVLYCEKIDSEEKSQFCSLSDIDITTQE